MDTPPMIDQVTDKLRGFILDRPERQDKPLSKLTVSEAKKYPLGPNWTTDGKVNLENVVNNLATFIEEVGQRSSPYRELTQELVRKPKTLEGSEAQEPYSSEIRDISRGSIRMSDRYRSPDASQFKAQSLDPQRVPQHIKWNKQFMDCEYMLKVHVPVSLQEKFSRLSGSCSSHDPKEHRWIFTPSYLRAGFGLFDWTNTKINEQKTHRVLVVRPALFDDYVKSCGNDLPVICLPHDEIGIGYARYWIMKMATRLGLKFVWMVDDSVLGFSKYGDDQQLNFEDALMTIETLFEDEDVVQHVAAMSPTRKRGGKTAANPFTYKPPQIAVYLNLELINKHRIQYRPELAQLEDMVFGGECFKNELTVCRYNRILLYDINWKDTGAAAPYKTTPQASPPIESTPGRKTAEAKKQLF